MEPLKFVDMPNEWDAIEMIDQFDHSADAVPVDAGTLYFLLNHYFSTPKVRPLATPNDHMQYKKTGEKLIYGVGVSRRNKDFKDAIAFIMDKAKSKDEIPTFVVQKIQELEALFLNE